MPKIGIHTHNTPPTTSIKDNSVNSAEGKYFALKCTKSVPMQLSSHEVNSNNYLSLAFQQRLKRET